MAPPPDPSGTQPTGHSLPEEISDPQQRLLWAAEMLFAQNGYDGTSVRQICDLAGMNVAAVNYHFGDKEKLYIEAVRQAHCASTPPMRMPEWPAKTSPVEKLRIYIRQTLTQMNKPLRPTALGLLMRELSHPSPITQQIVEDFIRPMAHGLFEILREVLPQLSDRHRLLIGLSIVGQCLYYRQNREVTKLLFGDSIFEELSTEILVDHVTRFTLAALGLEKPYPKLILKDLEKGGG